MKLKIMKVVYSQEKSVSHMGEESWTVGENFNGEFVKGVVTYIHLYESRGVVIDVDGQTVMFIPLHAVQRIYYGEE